MLVSTHNAAKDDPKFLLLLLLFLKCWDTEMQSHSVNALTLKNKK